MRKRRTYAYVFLSGLGTALLALVILIAVGVLPVQTERTVVVRQQGSSASTRPASSVTSDGLTPAQIYEQASPGVVEVLATFSMGAGQDFFGQPQSAQALGSGFVVSEDGYVLSNAHVVVSNGTKADSVVVVFKGDSSDDAANTKRVSARVVGIDETSDVALLKVDPEQAGDLHPLKLGDSDSVQVGEPVVAIGNPLGYDFSLTAGIVSATDRTLQSPNDSVIPNGIQTDAAINEGNSGGPLINSRGEVIGINEQIASQSGGNQGLGFAVPINTAIRVMDQLKDSGSVKYAWLGVQGQTLTEDVAKALGMDATEGVLVAQVVDGSPAARAGIRGGETQQNLQGQVYVVGGDVITAIDGQKLQGMDDLASAIAERKPGDEITLTVVRESSTKDVKATLSERPQSF